MTNPFLDTIARPHGMTRDPLESETLMREQGFHRRQCAAHSKRSGLRCLNYAMVGRPVCKFHGGRARSGTKHPAFKHGRFAKGDLLAEILNRPPADIRLTIFMFPSRVSEMKGMRGDVLRRHVVYKGDLMAYVGGSANLTDDELAKLLRRLRRFATSQLVELRERGNGAATG